jgi:hypothetical protein
MKSMQRKSKRSSVSSAQPMSTGRQPSKGSLPTSSPEDDDAALLALVGGKVTQAPQIDPSDLEVAVVVGRIRGQILAAAESEGIGVREIARRLKVSAAAVSRQLRSEGDMRVSTAVTLARALGQRWHFTLSPCDPVSNASESAVTTATEGRQMELPNSFSCNGISFRTERATPYESSVTHVGIYGRMMSTSV